MSLYDLLERETPHFLPRSYLEGFSSDGFIFVFDKNEKTMKRLPLSELPATKDFVEFIDERDLATVIYGHPDYPSLERLAIRIIGELEEGRRIDSFEKELLACFVGFLMMRLTARDNHRKTDKITRERIKKASRKFRLPKNLVEQFERERKERELWMSPEERELIQFGRETWQKAWSYRSARGRKFLQFISDYGCSDAVALYRQEWGIRLRSRQTAFITSDNPFVLIPPEGWMLSEPAHPHVTTDGTIKIIPLSPKVCLVSFDRGRKISYKSYDDSMMQIINLKNSHPRKESVLINYYCLG